ncbi:MAG TPA: cbb3-type cytochrome c oxidase subunit I [Geobacteraceae bacterium]|nr:cbb3-type cytochrome c oxidase subunit I [Geobacteraceae bacterium]
MSSGNTAETLSPWWRNSVILVLVIGFSILIWIAVRAYSDAPPIPERVVNSKGETVFTSADILAGQQVFLKYGLMENGTVWGHGAYVGPDFSAEYLHTLTLDAKEMKARSVYRLGTGDLTPIETETVNAEVRRLLKDNRYSPETGTLLYTAEEIASFNGQIGKWAAYFSNPALNGGLMVGLIKSPAEIRQLTVFFAWAAWASAANRPGKSYSYTNNFPYDPAAGNMPGSASILWSTLSLITLLGGIAAVLFAFGKFNYLGWKGKEGHVRPFVPPGTSTISQRATIKFFVIVAVLFLAQVLVGGATAHYRADPSSFFGLDLAGYFPGNIFRTWHLQLAVFWVATAYVAGGLFLAGSLGGKEPKGQARGINLLFWALVIVVFGSLLGEMFGVYQKLGKLWFWFGHQGWEYLDLGRAWQILLALDLVFWLFLLFREIAPVRSDPERWEISSLFLFAAAAIPLFYLPAMFFGSASNFSVVDNWRFWIIHLWVEGFFELFATVLVAVIFFQLGLITRLTASRVVYLDAILYLGSGIVGTGHHWYWTGQSTVTMALAAMFSAMEVVPLTLLTLDAWDFIKVTRAQCEMCDKKMAVAHKWTFYFLIAVGFWNFVGAGVFGFLINLPIVSYFEVGTLFTPNHGHAAMMGVFGMLALALMVFAMRQVSTDEQWIKTEKYVRVSFWGLNAGLALMVATNLFPGGVLQFADVLNNGYWHARGADFLNSIRIIEWLRMPADVIFIGLGVVPMLVATALTWAGMGKPAADEET